MQCSSTVDITLEYRDRQFVVQEVPYSVSYDYGPGCRYCANGDPGESPSEDFQFTCGMTVEEVIEVIAEAFIADSEAVPAWVAAEASSILHAIQKEAYDRVYDRLVSSV